MLQTNSIFVWGMGGCNKEKVYTNQKGLQEVLRFLRPKLRETESLQECLELHKNFENFEA